MDFLEICSKLMCLRNSGTGYLCHLSIMGSSVWFQKDRFSGFVCIDVKIGFLRCGIYGMAFIFLEIKICLSIVRCPMIEKGRKGMLEIVLYIFL